MDIVAALTENAHPTVRLTKREHSLFLSLTRGEQTREDLLVSSFGWARGGAAGATYKQTRSVDMVVSRLKRKVGPLGLIITSVRGKGYRLIG